MDHKKRKKLFITAIVLSVFVICILFMVIDRYAHYKSPNEKYSLSVYRVPLPFASMGGGSDAPGIIVLYTDLGIPVKACILDMVQNETPPKWDEDRVYMKLTLDWKFK